MRHLGQHHVPRGDGRGDLLEQLAQDGPARVSGTERAAGLIKSRLTGALHRGVGLRQPPRDHGPRQGRGRGIHNVAPPLDRARRRRRRDRERGRDARDGFVLEGHRGRPAGLFSHELGFAAGQEAASRFVSEQRQFHGPEPAAVACVQDPPEGLHASRAHLTGCLGRQPSRPGRPGSPFLVQARQLSFAVPHVPEDLHHRPGSCSGCVPLEVWPDAIACPVRGRPDQAEQPPAVPQSLDLSVEVKLER